MSRQLRTYVEVDGRWYAPGVDVPNDVAGKISNPKAWAESDDAEDDAPPTRKAPAKRN